MAMKNVIAPFLVPADFISGSAYSHYKELFDKSSVKPYLVYMNKLNDVWVSDAYLWMKYNGKTEADFEDVISEVVFYTFLMNGKLGGRPCVFVGERQVGNKMRNT